VREGQRVAAGQRVGAVGTSGDRSATQPHLHFGVRDAGTAHGYHDPLGFLPPAADAPNGPREAPAPHAVPVTAGPGRAPGRGPAPLRAPAPVAVPTAVPAPHADPAAEPAIPAWAIACAALLGAAALGLAASGRTATHTARAARRRRIAALLKPRLETR
jgi:hypothetical protein